jgi:hypothetical protein
VHVAGFAGFLSTRGSDATYDLANLGSYFLEVRNLLEAGYFLEVGYLQEVSSLCLLERGQVPA